MYTNIGATNTIIGATLLGLSCDTLRLHFVCAKRGREFVCTQI